MPASTTRPEPRTERDEIAALIVQHGYAAFGFTPTVQAAMRLASVIVMRKRAEAAEAPALDVERLAEALHAARIGCSTDICDPTPALYQGLRRTMHETDARDLIAELARLQSTDSPEPTE